MNKTLKNYLFFFIFLFLFSTLFNKNALAESNTNNQEKEVEILFFKSPTCAHCSNEKKFLEKLSEKHPQIKIKEYELSKNIELVSSLYDKYQVPAGQRGLVPATFINDSFFIGFNSDISQKIEQEIKGIEKNNSSFIVKIPFKGEVDIFQYSLPVLAIILGTIDGFNVCSLGSLVVILGLAMILRSRKKVLLLGGTFILITSLTYGLLIFLWHQFFVLISPYIRSTEILIAILSLVGGIYLLIEFFRSIKKGASCSSNGLISKLSSKIEKIFSSKKNLFILLGVVFLFALAITIIEFPCSAFLPMLFAGLLAESGLNLGATIAHMSLFILFYMLDEIIIFLIAVFTLKVKIFNPKFINLFNLIAALIFLSLGSFYLFRIF